jgi:hypothetical protein
VTKARNRGAALLREICRPAAAGILVVALFAPASALDRREQRTVYASAGRETRIAAYGAPNQKCQAEKQPAIQVVERPSYGTLTEKLARTLAERSGLARQDDPCIGKFIEAVALYYRPADGFHGSDHLRVRVKFDASPSGDPLILEQEIFVSVR